MFSVRTRLRPLAALLLVLWLFAFGAALAQACVTHAHPAAEDCCTTIQAATRHAGPLADAVAPAHPMQVLPPAAPAVAPLSPPVPELPLPGRPPGWSDNGQRIPIVFLRLAL